MITCTDTTATAKVGIETTIQDQLSSEYKLNDLLVYFYSEVRLHSAGAHVPSAGEIT